MATNPFLNTPELAPGSMKKFTVSARLTASQSLVLKQYCVRNGTHASDAILDALAKTIPGFELVQP